MLEVFVTDAVNLTIDESGMRLGPDNTTHLWWPVVEVNDFPIDSWTIDRVTDVAMISGNIAERVVHLRSLAGPSVHLEVSLRNHADSGVIRFRHRLSANPSVVMTKRGGEDSLSYAKLALGEDETVTEIQLSQFEKIAQSFVPQENVVDPVDVVSGTSVVGPMVVVQGAGRSVLLAYEHGAQSPDSYLHFELAAGRVDLRAKKGNYVADKSANGFVSAWFDVVVGGSKDEVLRQFREFVRVGMNPYPASRSPKTFYNTWNYQERGHWYAGAGYIENLNETRVLQEIDVAHRMGIDVYVIDVGWFGQTGEWKVDTRKFPRGLRPICDYLEARGMELGIWFNPIVAAKSSTIVAEHPEFVMSRDGVVDDWGEIWETEASLGMCLVSEYSGVFARELVSISRETGATYFKWDAIGQYGCNSPDHDHGDASHSAQERLESYSYEMGLRMIEMADYVNSRVKGAVIDFDITDGHRFVGLGFLGVGKYFLMNNGPFFPDFDIPTDKILISPNTLNVFVHAGWARNRVCRQAARWDYIIPSQLLLTHFLPDGDPREEQLSIDSMYVAGNGMWGDLLGLTEEQVSLWAEGNRKYKNVAVAAARSYPRYRGDLGASPEIYEKIDSETSTGFVTFFSQEAGDFCWTTPTVDSSVISVSGADRVETLPGGNLKLHVRLQNESSRTVFLTR